MIKFLPLISFMLVLICVGGSHASKDYIDIFIDPGHGGTKPGTISYIEGYDEKYDDIVASDIYLADLKSNDEIQIINTPDKIELSPTISPDRTLLAYIFLKSLMPITWRSEILSFSGTHPLHEGQC